MFKKQILAYNKYCNLYFIQYQDKLKIEIIIFLFF